MIGQEIAHVLGSKYLMFYHHAIESSYLTPVATLDQSLETINSALDKFGIELSIWPAMLQNEMARLVNVKIIFQNLETNPIRKPILFHIDGDEYVVDCGDTRLMALSLLNHTVTVPAVTTCLPLLGHKFSHWKQINNNKDLVSVCNFQDSAQIFYQKSTVEDYAISWLEIGDSTTLNLMYHDSNDALAEAQKVLNARSKQFKFSKQWFRESM